MTSTIPGCIVAFVPLDVVNCQICTFAMAPGETYITSDRVASFGDLRLAAQAHSLIGLTYVHF